ncbi:hypothetical protein HPG69_012707 [Diceros bicornis minor]|uniref:Natural cytotoxicity triggering receptor 3 n=1 Tax=Diceros bicornis minor TaxID=77932 RepID=A0A7J7EI92_DICBM|nr:hypothetical protein HPG69_012707 [Diceros bicornis minor]
MGEKEGEKWGWGKRCAGGENVEKDRQAERDVERDGENGMKEGLRLDCFYVPVKEETSLLTSPSSTGTSSDMARMLLLVFIVVQPGSCALWVSQPPEIHTQEGATAFLPCSFNASQGKPAIGSVTWYRDKVALGKEMRNETPEFRGRLASVASARFLCDHQAELHIWDIRGHDAGVYVCRVEVLGLGVGTGNGTLLVVEKAPSTTKANVSNGAQATVEEMGGAGRELEEGETETERRRAAAPRDSCPLHQATVTWEHTPTPWMASDE